jgi:hypothetical protein
MTSKKNTVQSAKNYIAKSTSDTTKAEVEAGSKDAVVRSQGSLADRWAVQHTPDSLYGEFKDQPES